MGCWSVLIGSWTVGVETMLNANNNKHFSSIYCLVILIIKPTVPMYSINMIILPPSGCGMCHFVVQIFNDFYNVNVMNIYWTERRFI